MPADLNGCWVDLCEPSAEERAWLRDPSMTRAELDAFGDGLERVAAERGAMTPDDVERLLDRLETEHG